MICMVLVIKIFFNSINHLELITPDKKVKCLFMDWAKPEWLNRTRMEGVYEFSKSCREDISRMFAKESSLYSC